MIHVGELERGHPVRLSAQNTDSRPTLGTGSFDGLVDMSIEEIRTEEARFSH